MTIEKLSPQDGQSLDVKAENIAKLKQLFPEIFSEKGIDFGVLKQLLGEEIEEAEERYSFTWNGKARARRLAQTPSTGTLRPCKEESKDWDTTQNLFIEGDNLEVLKLLQKSYHQKVKMIYIDPPYNTGKDFVYLDDYRDNIKNYLELTGQTDISGKKLSVNTETSGRYHTNWLNMMYPRLKLARNLLREDGVIFISIDDIEFENLKKLCNEIFGEENFIANVIHKSNALKNQTKFIGVSTEYVVVFAKNIELLKKGNDWKEVKVGASDVSNFALKNLSEGKTKDEVLNLVKELYARPKYSHLSRWNKIDDLGIFMDGDLSREGGKKEYTISNPLTGLPCPIPPRGWAKSYEELLELQRKELIWYGDGSTPPRIKSYLLPDTVSVPDNYKYFDTSKDKKLIDDLFQSRVFEYPKSMEMLKNFIGMCCSENDFVLDFFSGSCSTAHAIMQLNSEDSGTRRFIMVQLPESCDFSSIAYQSGFSSIAEIGKERIRRGGKKIIAERTFDSNTNTLDVGFKAFKLDSSNLKQWDADFDSLSDDLLSVDEVVKPERTADDVLFEILLKYGLDLSLPIKTHILSGKNVFDVGAGALLVCLEKDITESVAEAIGTLKVELAPAVCRVVFRDLGFVDDAAKVNAVQVLKQFGIDDVKSL